MDGEGNAHLWADRPCWGFCLPDKNQSNNIQQGLFHTRVESKQTKSTLVVLTNSSPSTPPATPPHAPIPKNQCETCRPYCNTPQLHVLKHGLTMTLLWNSHTVLHVVFAPNSPPNFCNNRKTNVALTMPTHATTVTNRFSYRLDRNRWKQLPATTLASQYWAKHVCNVSTQSCNKCVLVRTHNRNNAVLHHAMEIATTICVTSCFSETIR